MCERILYLNGAFAPYIRVPGRIVRMNMHRLPARTPFEEAAFAEPLACVLHAERRVPRAAGDRLAVVGCGPMGLLFIGALRLRRGRAVRILALDHHADRLAAARTFGADETINAARRRVSAKVDVAIEAVGTVEAHEEALGLVGRAGTLVSFGGVAPGSRLGVDIGRMHYEEISILPVYHHTPEDYREAVGCIVRREIPVGRLITGRLPLSRLAEALDSISAREGLRTIIDPRA
jgi:L-iditol 2-dehydrogenase